MRNLTQLLRMFLLFVLLTKITLAATQAIYPFTSASDADRFAALTKEIRCVVCQNQNIADSSAPLANDLRQKVYAMVQQHQSDKTIKDYLAKRYGDFILLQPRFSYLTIMLWLFPFIAILMVFLLILRRKNFKFCHPTA